MVYLQRVYVHSAIYETYVVYCFSKDLPAFGGWGWGVNLHWEYVNSAIYGSFLV